MSSRKFKDSMPLAPLKIVALGNQTELGEKINKEIIARRHKALSEMQKPDFKMTGYDTENYLVSYDCPRFGTGFFVGLTVGAGVGVGFDEGDALGFTLGSVEGVTDGDGDGITITSSSLPVL